MKKILCVVLIGIIGLTTGFQSMYAEENELKEQWIKEYSYDVYVQNAKATSDEGYIAVGWTTQNAPGMVNLGGQDGWVSKLNKDGSEAWTRQYGTSSNDELFAVTPTSDGGYVAAGYVQQALPGEIYHGMRDAWILKIDANGNTQWSKQYGDANTNIMYEVIPANDGGYLAFGTTATTANILAIKVDANGNEVWQKEYSKTQASSTLGNQIRSVVSTGDGYIAVGHTERGNGNADYDGWALKIQNDGNEIWSKQYGGPDYERFISIEEVSDGFIIAGQKDTPTIGQAILTKIDIDGNEQWTKSYSGSGDIYLSGMTMLNGKIMMAAAKKGSNKKVELISTEEDGTLQSVQPPLVGHDFSVAGIAAQKDSGFIVFGYINTVGKIVKYGYGDIDTNTTIEETNKEVTANSTKISRAPATSDTSGSTIMISFLLLIVSTGILTRKKLIK